MPALLAMGLLGVAGGVWYWRSMSPAPEPALIERVAQAPLPVTPAVVDEPRPAPVTPPLEPADEQEARMMFHARTRQFFAAAPALPANERAAQAESIAAQVVQYERRGELSAGESLLLQIALIRESSAAAAQQRQRIVDLQRTYREDAERRQAAAAAQPDPMFEIYKLREGAIVASISAMNEIPNGLSRDEYLRQRLQAERELLLSDAN